MILNRLKALGMAAVLALAGLGLSACKDESNNRQANVPAASSNMQFTIVSGSENEPLKPILDRFAASQGATIKFISKGSVDIMLDLEQGNAIDADAVWPAANMWLALGDKQRVVKYTQSIYRTPVVLAVKKSKAEKLGWVGKDVRVADILRAAKSGQLRFMMSSATQSNSGASAYFGFLYAFAGSPDVLSLDDLDKPSVQTQIKSILGTVDRTAGSSNWVKDLFLKQYMYYDAMVNYEALAIESNQELVQRNQEPLYLVYPVDGLSIADSPLGYVSKGDAAKEAFFQKLQEYLLSEPVQNELLSIGRRTGFGGNVTKADPKIFNPAWGIDISKTLVPINMPAADVIHKGLTLYQVAFRKPSITALVIDYSGSMQGNPENQLEIAIDGLLNQQIAAQQFLQASPDDVTIVVPFSSSPWPHKVVKGNNPAELTSLSEWVRALSASGGTDIYAPVITAMEEIKKIPGWEDYSVSVILMTDGRSDGSFQQMKDRIAALNMTGVPIYSILFGDASRNQLDAIADWSNARVFDGKKDLIKAFRQAKGYN